MATDKDSSDIAAASLDTADTLDAGAPEPKQGRFRWLRNRFFTGVIIALPLLVTIWLISWFVGAVDDNVLKHLPPEANPNTYIKKVLGFDIPGTGLIIAIIALTLLGIFASNIIGTSLLRFGERLLNRVPLVSNIYSALKQIVTTVAQQQERAFKDVCLIEYPRKGIWAVGFITADLKGAPSDHLQKGYVCVFVPTTPNPTSGFLLFVKEEELRILDMTPEEGAKMIISGGMVATNEEIERMENVNIRKMSKAANKLQAQVKS